LMIRVRHVFHIDDARQDDIIHCLLLLRRILQAERRLSLVCIFNKEKSNTTGGGGEHSTFCSFVALSPSSPFYGALIY
jgi:hypothetical protein